MKLIEPSVTVIDEPDILKRIELCGRVAYQSEDKICEGSAKRFYDVLVKRGHESVLEHSRIYVKTLDDESTKMLRYILTEYENITGVPHYIRNCGSNNANANYDDNIWSGNLRAWRSIAKKYMNEPMIILLFANSALFEDISFNTVGWCCEDWLDNSSNCNAMLIHDDPLHRDAHEYVTFKIELSRATANEFVRHRGGSFTQSSTRYINYQDDVPFVKAWWTMEENASKNDIEMYEAFLKDSEFNYARMFDLQGAQPQKSRAILPCETAATLCFTGTIEYFDKYVLPLRTASGAHPDARIIANQMKTIIDERKEKKDDNTHQ